MKKKPKHVHRYEQEHQDGVMLTHEDDKYGNSELGIPLRCGCGEYKHVTIPELIDCLNSAERAKKGGVK